MRWKATILLFYILALFMVPCGDTNNTCGTLSKFADETTHRHSNDSDDYCTPFCQCTCCSISVVSFNFEIPELGVLTQIFSREKVIIPDFKFISQYSDSIWQPPKFYV